MHNIFEIPTIAILDDIDQNSRALYIKDVQNFLCTHDLQHIKKKESRDLQSNLIFTHLPEQTNDIYIIDHIMD